MSNSHYFSYWLGLLSNRLVDLWGYNWNPGWMVQRFGRQFFPIKRATYVSIGYMITYFDSPHADLFRAQGVIWTNGTNGIKEWEGTLKGGFFEFTWGDPSGFQPHVSFVGVKCFRGLNFNFGEQTRFIGFAREVKIEYWNS